MSAKSGQRKCILFKKYFMSENITLHGKKLLYFICWILPESNFSFIQELSYYKHEHAVFSRVLNNAPYKTFQTVHV